MRGPEHTEASRTAQPAAGDGRTHADEPKRRRGRRRKRSASEHSAWAEKNIAGVPARIMRPRLVFLACLAAIVAFGLVMVYSASSVEALKEQGSSTYYLERQAMFIGVGLVLLAFISSRIVPWWLFRSNAFWVVWLVLVLLLIVVRLFGAGGEDWGASRWIVLGPFSLQPSEFAKPLILLGAAKFMAEFYEDHTIDQQTFLFSLGGCVLVPLFLIVIQPDLGTTVIIVMAVFAMAYLAGISYRLIAYIAVALGIAVAVTIAISPYRLTRFLIALDPWSDPYGDGYQSTLAIMAFASGGLFGRGIGNSTMKYSYLPEAHNDYILSIIGEELGLVGTAVLFIVFATMIVAAFNIARRSPTLYGRLLASGCAFLLALQFAINALGILAVIPMTGKPLPFISYGGSSVMSSLILAALILRVSRESNVVTAADARRARLAVMDEADAVSSHLGRSTAGAARVRRSGEATGARAGFSVYEGGAGRGERGDAAGRADAAGRPAPDARAGRGRPVPLGGYTRVDLGAQAADRLRQEGPRTAGGRPSGTDRGRSGPRTRERGRYDR